MQARRKVFTTVLSTAAVMATAGLTFGQSFVQVGPDTDVSDMSDDGAIVVGNLFSGGGYIWTEADGLTPIGGGSGSPYISADGSTVVGEDTDADGKGEAAIWMGGTNWQLLGGVPGGESCDAFFSSAWGTNGDGSQIVGLAWVPNCRAHAFIYDAVNGMVDLGTTVDGRSTRANGIADDGSVIVGWQDAVDGFRQGASWTNGVQTLYTMTLNGQELGVGEAQAANADGSVIVGSNNPLLGGWRWTAAGGVEDTGTLSGFNYSGHNTDVSDDGNTIVGFSGFAFDRQAHIWTADGGLEQLDAYLIAHGVNVPDGWSSQVATAISGDGRTIAGFGFDAQFNLSGFVATLPGPTGLNLTVDPLVAGSKSLIQVDGADAGARIVLAYSTVGEGSTDIPQLNVTLGLDSARFAKIGLADDSGHASYMAQVPAAWGGTEIWIQAAARETVSNIHHEVIGN